MLFLANIKFNSAAISQTKTDDMGGLTDVQIKLYSWDHMVFGQF
jgi:hypothetical protein